MGYQGFHNLLALMTPLGIIILTPKYIKYFQDMHKLPYILHQFIITQHICMKHVITCYLHMQYTKRLHHCTANKI